MSSAAAHEEMHRAGPVILPVNVAAQTATAHEAEPVDVMHVPLLLRGHRPPPEREWHTRGEERVLPEVSRDSVVSREAVIAEEGSSRRWFWTAGSCTLVVAFCVGLFFVERAADMPLDIGSAKVDAPAPQPIASDLGASHTVDTPAPAAAVPVAPTGPAPANPTPAPPTPNSEFTGTAHPEQAIDTPRASVGAPSGRPRPWRNAGQVRYAPTALFGVSPGMMRGHLLYAPQPEYPRMARLAHVEGQVSVEAVVTREGSVSQANVLSGHRLLRNAALRAVRERRYRPYLVNGRPTDVATILTVDFRLK